MHDKLVELKEKLIVLSEQISNSSLPNEPLDTIWGWDSFYFSKGDIESIIYNFNDKLNKYAPEHLNEQALRVVEYYIDAIERLTGSTDSFFQNTSQHTSSYLSFFITSLQLIIQELDHELFSFEALENTDLLPQKLTSRLRSINSSISKIEQSCTDLDMKSTAINDAYSAAESLPTDLESLREAREELESYLRISKSDMDKNVNDSNESLKLIKALHEKSLNTQFSALELLKKIELSAGQAQERVEQCDDALKITTTQGLAAGFDQKATELRKSINLYLFGLLTALAIGGLIGAIRVEDLTSAMTKDLTSGQAIIHALMSLFSIGGPLWLAWICTQQINQRFKLSEDYSYKATVAKSFVGFSAQAQRFSPETEERLFNSTLDRIEEMPLRLIEGKDYNSPWHEFIDSEAFKTAASSFPQLIDAAGKFAKSSKLKKSKVKPKDIPTSPEKSEAMKEE